MGAFFAPQEVHSDTKRVLGQSLVREFDRPERETERDREISENGCRGWSVEVRDRLLLSVTLY